MALFHASLLNSSLGFHLPLDAYAFDSCRIRDVKAVVPDFFSPLHFPLKDAHDYSSRTRFIVMAGKRSPKKMKYFGGRRIEEALMLSTTELEGGFLSLEQESLGIAADMIKEGSVGIVPTDTVYAFVCDLNNRDAVERLYRVKDMDQKKPLSILCRSFQDIDSFTAGFPRGGGGGRVDIFRSARQCLPGPYTFILRASKALPKQCVRLGGSEALHCAPRRSVGVRIPDNRICMSLLQLLDGPLISTSVPVDTADGVQDPQVLLDIYGGWNNSEGIDFVLHGGVRAAAPSTVVDMTGDMPVVLREGKGMVEEWMVLADEDEGGESLTVGGRFNPYATAASTQVDD